MLFRWDEKGLTGPSGFKYRQALKHLKAIPVKKQKSILWINEAIRILLITSLGAVDVCR